MDAELVAFIVLIYLIGAALAVLLIAALVLGLSFIFGLWARHRRKIVRTLAGAGITIAAALGIMFLTGMLGLPEPDPNDDKHMIAAARARVTSQFRDAKGVQFQQVWVGRGRAFQAVVCGTVDSDEITHPSRFIFTRDTDQLQLSGSGEGPPREQLTFQFPPAIQGSKPTDAAYWENVMSESSAFNSEWLRQCERERPGGEESGER